MRWRKITQDDICKAVEAPEKIERAESGKFHYFKKMDQGWLRVTVAKEAGKIVVVTALIKNV